MYDTVWKNPGIFEARITFVVTSVNTGGVSWALLFSGDNVFALESSPDWLFVEMRSE